MTYYNTTNLRGEALKQEMLNTESQEEIIFTFFLAHPKIKTPCTVQRRVQKLLGVQWPLTSVRRAITNLTDEGKLKKTNKQRIGIYGKLAHCWKLNCKKQKE